MARVPGHPVAPVGLRRAAIRTALLAVLAGGAVVPHQAEAFEIFGFRIFGEDEPAEETSPDATSYTIDVVVAGGDEEVADTVRGASRLWREREDPPPPSTAALVNRAEAEYARIVGALYARGRYGPTVVITLNGRDPLDVRPDERFSEPVRVEIAVDPGPPFRFGRVEIAGRAPPPADEDDEVELPDDAAELVPGNLARSAAVLSTERVLVEEWRQQGYPKAEIATRDVVADHPSTLLDVSIVAASGPMASFGPVTVTGTEFMDPEFVAWMTGIRPGEAYDPDAIERAERNLRRLQVFAATSFVEGDVVGPDGRLPMELNVAERPRRALGAGASYSTVDGAGVEGYWEHRNLFGRAERLRLDARVGGVDAVDPGEFDYYLGASFLKPGVITPFTDLTGLLSAEQNDLETYRERTIRARVGLAHEIAEGFTVSSSLNVEASRIRDAVDTREYLLASLPSEIAYDGRDDPLDPTRGYRARLGLEPFYEANYGNAGVIADLSASTYYALDAEEDFVLAVRGAVGSLVGAPADEMPENRLFLAGGGGSVRGYAYRNIGPRVNGEVVGGRSYVAASLELRAKVTDSIGVVPFIDAGSAFDSSFPDFSEDIKIGAGIGLRYHTGIGPIRADIAVPLDPDDDDPSFAIYIGLGQSF